MIYHVLTKKVAATNPTPTQACRALVKGLDLMGPMVKTKRLWSAVMNAPKAMFWIALTVTRRPKLDRNGKTTISKPFRPIVTQRKASLAKELRKYLKKRSMILKFVSMVHLNKYVLCKLND